MELIGTSSPNENTIIFDEAAYAVRQLSPDDLAAKRGDRFTITLFTNRYRPNHQITIRNNVDGWTRDIFGVYTFGGWNFTLERSNYPAGLEFKFVLDGQYWMEGNNLFVTNQFDHNFTDDPQQFPEIFNPTIIFPNAPSKFLHGYDNLRNEDGLSEQERFPGNRDQSILYDVIIIGSGMGGGILADALSDAERNIDVLVLDVGSLHTPTHLSNVYADWDEITNERQVGHYELEPGSNFLFGAQMALGGRSIYWSGIILRMQNWEYSYWPNSIQTFLQDEGGKGYERAEILMRKRKYLGQFQERVISRLKNRLPDLNIEDLPRSRHQPDLNAQNQIDSVLFNSTGVFSTADLLSDSKAFVGATGSENLTINLNHLVTEIKPNPDNPQEVQQVVCQDLASNTTRTYRGKVIVLAAGSVESPKIFQQSNLTDDSGKVGVGLTDHPYLFSSQYTIPRDNPLWGDLNHSKVLLWAGNASKNNYPFYAELLINPWYWTVRRADDDLWQRQPEELRTTQITMKFGFSNELVDDNWVRSQGTDLKAKIKVNNLFLSDQAKEQARLFRNRILDALEIPGDRNQGMGLAQHGGTINHSGGTLRIGSRGQGVVDENLRFHNYDNLYAADVSVFPYIPTANPSLTLGALALRLSDHLKTRFGL
ncbi:MAG TPA: GMC family oxidoreductase [Cyanothece sp. UBA12306]|nr:GMC family oxidoreductase [Cyanothece sp. UBA12306]